MSNRTLHSIDSLQNVFQKYINEHKFTHEPQALYDPVNYILSLGGKRLRPVLLLMSYNLFDDEVERALPAAFAVEIFHNFSLLHDDIMDEAPLRRGKPAVHIKYGTNTGILSGDVMLIYAYEYLLKTDDKTIVPLLFELFNKVAIEVCEGQQYDMNFETQAVVEISAYLKMIELKTAVLLAGGMQMGAHIAGAEEADAKHISEFARNIGIAFQLQDDILDTYGDPEKFGKKVGGDIVQNKKTYLVLKTLELADDTTKEALNNLMSTPTTDETAKINAVKKIFNEVNVRSHAEKIKEDYLKIAFDHLDAINVPNERKQLLRQLSEQLMGRES